MQDLIKQSIAQLPVQGLIARVIQPGRTRMVLAHVVLPPDYRIGSLSMLNTIGTDTLARLQTAYPATTIDLVLTADPDWGALEGQTRQASSITTAETGLK